jgi:lactate racemase
MKIRLPYGKGHLDADVPDSSTVITGRPVPPLDDPAGAIRSSLRSPVGSPALGALARPGMSAVIVHTDGTRATPNHILLPVIVDELNVAGIPDSRITLLNATGSHRAQSATELRELLGSALVDRCRCVQHDARDSSSLEFAGVTTRGNRVMLNRSYLEADLKIVTGFIEPHFFAGYSGGPKLLLPGIAGMESIMANHCSALVAHPDATWGITTGNPLWEELAAAARLAPPDFSVNVALDPGKRVTGVFAGGLFAAHAHGCAFVKEHAMAPVDSPFDVVVTSNSGHPLDQNLYQAVKGMSAASRITVPGGTIVIAAACAEGMPVHGNYAALLSQFGTPGEAARALESRVETLPDQWQALIHARLASRFDIRIVTSGLDDGEISRAWLSRSASVEEAVGSALQGKRNARIGLLPDGPQVIPYLREKR